MNSLNLIEIFSIIIIHWFSDFVLQTDKQAKGKSRNWNDLLSHTITYSAVWIIPIGFLLGTNPPNGFYFILITVIAHTITDYFTSRFNFYLWTKVDVHNFFVSVGFDQVLHYVQLFVTYTILKS